MKELEVIPFDQSTETVFPAHAVAVAETVRDGVVQVMVPLVVAVTLGLQVSALTVTDEATVQPLDWDTVTV